MIVGANLKIENGILKIEIPLNQNVGVTNKSIKVAQTTSFHTVEDDPRFAISLLVIKRKDGAAWGARG